MADVKCKKDEFYNKPTGECRHCGWLCDIPATYPDSCQTSCPDYIPKGRTRTSPLQTSSSGQNYSWKSDILVWSLSVCAFLVLLVMLYFIWRKVIKRPYHDLIIRFQDRKLTHPVQPQSVHDVSQETVPLSSSGGPYDTDFHSGLMGNSETRSIPSFNDIEANQSTSLPFIDRPTYSPIMQYESETFDSSGFTSSDFNFGETFPFHSLESLHSVLGLTTGQKHRKATPQN